MSEAWHQHLANLSWWEEIERFFFPGAYKCTIPTMADNIQGLLSTVLFVGIALGIALLIMRYKHKSFHLTQQSRKQE